MSGAINRRRNANRSSSFIRDGGGRVVCANGRLIDCEQVPTIKGPKSEHKDHGQDGRNDQDPDRSRASYGSSRIGHAYRLTVWLSAAS